MAHVVSLDRNEYFFSHPLRVQQTLLRGAETNFVSKYSVKTKSNELSAALAEIIRVDPRLITMGHGAEDIIIKLLTWFRRFSSDYVFLDFSWKTYMDIAEGLEYNVHNIPCTRVSTTISTEFGILHDFLSTYEKPCVIILTSPNNPTGHALDTENIASLVKNHPRHIFLLDGVYDVPNSEKLQLVMDFSNLYFIGSFSKFFGLPGLRLGYCVAEHVPAAFHLALGLPPAAIETALAALSEARVYLENRNIMLKDAAQIKLLSNDFIRIFPTSAPFFLVEILSNIASVSEILEDAANTYEVKPKIFTHKNKLYLRWGLGPSEINKKIYNYLEYVSNKISTQYSLVTHNQRSGVC